MTITGSNTDRVVDVNDDLTRETFFYERALESANECVRKLKDLDVPVRRPDDYYAEMVKSDEHMKRVRSELLHEQQQLEIREERRKAREAKKFGKQVQAEKVKQRTLDKKAQIKSLDKWRKMRQKSGFADDGKAPFDGADDGRRGSKRAARDAKFGFGGRKKVRWFACLIERAFYPLLLLLSFFCFFLGGARGAARIPSIQRDEALSIYGVYLCVNTLNKSVGRRLLSRGRLPTGRTIFHCLDGRNVVAITSRDRPWTCHSALSFSFLFVFFLSFPIKDDVPLTL